MEKLPESYNGVVELIIRPTGLLDPVIELRPSLPQNLSELKKELERCEYTFMPIYNETSETWNDPQIVDLIKEIAKTIKNKERVLVTTLTKRMAEDLSDYLLDKNIKAKYLHSDIDTVERVEILRDLRKGKYDVVVGINLLREGLDLPEVSLVAILDADKEGFLRSDTSLIQTIGRAARHENGRVIMYSDKVTKSMKRAIDETFRRRSIQEQHNIENGITPRSIKKDINDQLERIDKPKVEDKEVEDVKKLADGYKAMTKKEQKRFKKQLKLQMGILADMMDFERAAEIRDILMDIESS